MWRRRCDPHPCRATLDHQGKALARPSGPRWLENRDAESWAQDPVSRAGKVLLHPPPASLIAFPIPSSLPPAPGKGQGQRKGSWERALQPGKQMTPAAARERPGRLTYSQRFPVLSSGGELGLFPSCRGLTKSDLKSTQVYINQLPLGTGWGAYN